WRAAVQVVDDDDEPLAVRWCRIGEGIVYVVEAVPGTGDQAELLAVLGDRRKAPEHGADRVGLCLGIGLAGRGAEPGRIGRGRLLLPSQLQLLQHRCPSCLPSGPAADLVEDAQ